jgi:uncharacterized protein (TIGR00251 family)
MILNIKVHPNSRIQNIEKISETEYEIDLKERAEDNKANIELLKLLKHHFKREARIIKGLKSKNKIVEVKNGDKI